MLLKTTFFLFFFRLVLTGFKKTFFLPIPSSLPSNPKVVGWVKRTPSDEVSVNQKEDKYKERDPHPPYPPCHAQIFRCGTLCHHKKMLVRLS